MNISTPIQQIGEGRRVENFEQTSFKMSPHCSWCWYCMSKVKTPHDLHGDWTSHRISVSLLSN